LQAINFNDETPISTIALNLRPEWLTARNVRKALQRMLRDRLHGLNGPQGPARNRAVFRGRGRESHCRSTHHGLI
jgi:hypothetical protein